MFILLLKFSSCQTHFSLIFHFFLDIKYLIFFQISYSVKQRDTHKNAWIAPKEKSHGPEFLDNFYFFILSFDTFNIEEHIESLVYDASSFLVSVGGNLGLFLGFSCLSVLFGLIGICKNNEHWWKASIK